MDVVTIDELRAAVMADPENAAFTERGWTPVFAASPASRILLIGQAPGAKAQATGMPFTDASGAVLLQWLGVDDATFRDPDRFAVLPMDFYFPGKGPSGDLLPRPGVAERWHPRLLALMPEVGLTLLVGATAQAHYLRERRKANLTDTVRAFREYLPAELPLVHPSPRTIPWQAHHPWFRDEVLPALRTEVARALA